MEYTTAQAAEMVGIHPVTARRLCAENSIGRMVSTRLRLLTKKDVARLERLKKEPGWPVDAASKERKSLSGKE